MNLKIINVLILLISFQVFAQEKDSTNIQIKEVVIYGSRYKSSVNLTSLTSSKLPITHLENPQSTCTVGNHLIQNRNYTTQGEMLSNATGVSPSWAGVARYYSIRGFRTRSSYRNGINGYIASDVDGANLAQLDVVKGPSAVTFGGGGLMITFGGLINRITHKPLYHKHINIFLTGGSYNHQRAVLDVNLPLDEEKRSLFRFISSYTHSDSFQDQGYTKNIFLAPSFTYEASDKLSFELEAEIYSKKSPNLPIIAPTPPMAMGKKQMNPSDFEFVDYRKSYIDNSLYWLGNAFNLYGKITYKINQNWVSETNFTSNNTQSNGFYKRLYLSENNTKLRRNVLLYDAEYNINQQIQQNFVGNFSVGSMQNKLYTGIEYYRYVYGERYRFLKAFDVMDLKNPSASDAFFMEDQVRARLYEVTPTNTRTTDEFYSAYFSDVLNITSNLAFMASLRLTNLHRSIDDYSNFSDESFTQRALSPKLGLSYQIFPQRLSTYVSYMSGFQNVAPFTQPDGSKSYFKPEEGSQWEVGFKSSLLDEKLDATLSFYDIRVKNIVRESAHNASFREQSGKRYSRGAEVDVHSHPLKGLYLHAGVAYNDSKLTQAVPDLQGLRPADSGVEWSGNWYVSYQMPQGKFRGFSIGLGGVHYTDDIITNSRSQGKFYTEGYWLLNGMLAYQGGRYVVSLTADNLLGREYWFGGRGFITQGNLRQVLLSLRLKM